MPAPQAMSGVRVLSGSEERGEYTRGGDKLKVNTAIAMVPNLRHAMISGEDITRLLVSVKLRHKQLRFTDDIVDNTDVVHVFLSRD
jgi:hypothetical protein